MRSPVVCTPKQWPCHLILPLFMVAVLGCAPVAAQPPDASNQKPLIDQLLKRIEELEATQKQMQKNVDQLRAAPAAAAPAASGPAASLVTAAAEPEPVQTADDPDQVHSLGPIRFSGFTDFNYGRALFEKPPPGGLRGPNSFNVGDFDLFTNTRLSEHWSMLGEVLVTTDFTNLYEVEIDRLMLSYRPSQYFNISVGKFNTALGYYPNAFHRARYFQIATGRPIMYADEDNDGLLPVHNVGVTATGKIRSESLGLHWVAEIVNGRASNTGDEPFQNFVDENNGKAVNLALYAAPEWLRGFQTGFSYYRDTLHPNAIGTIHQGIFTVHAVYVGSKFEWLNEAAIVRNALAGSNQVFRSLTSYTEVSRAFGKTRPYFRYDYQNTPVSDVIYGSFGRRNGPSIGVNERLSNFIVLKVQYGRLEQREIQGINDFQAQLAIAF